MRLAGRRNQARQSGFFKELTLRSVVGSLPDGRIAPPSVFGSPAGRDRFASAGTKLTMRSLSRFLGFVGLIAALSYAGMFALVSVVEPTQREFVVTIPQDRIGNKVAGTANPKRGTETPGQDQLQDVEAGRLARVLESLQIPR